MSIKFIHTADLQIGKVFGQLPRDISAQLRITRLDTLKRIAELAEKNNVDAVLVAGDCFDDIAVSDETIRRFKVALEPFKGTWVLLPGNHDPAIAESPWSRLKRLNLPPNIIIADEAKPILIDGKATIFPAPLKRRRDVADGTDWFDTADSDSQLIRIGLAHGSIPEFTPGGGGDATNPIALDRDMRAKLDYLALGDWHGKLKISDRTWYSGTPEPDRFRDNDPGYILEVSIDSPGALPSIEPIEIAKYRWKQLTLEIMPNGADDIIKSLGIDESELAQLVLRIKVQGTVDLETRSALDDTLADLGARVTHLELNDTDLAIQPTDNDLDTIDTAGFVRTGMNRLREKLDGPEADNARRALALLYGLHHQSGG